AADKPLFLYWGATWCPPCNQVKATIFNRQDFIERSRAFVPVYVDGDRPGAQKVGARFHVNGYPTMLLFNPQGTELTRLPGEVAAAHYTQVLTLGMGAQRPVKEVVALALADPKNAPATALSENEWRLLAFYSWGTDQQQIVSKDGVGALLKKLADACPAEPAEVATRLRLKALAAADPPAASKPDTASQAMLLALLADAPAARAQMDVLTNDATDIVRALTFEGEPRRAELLAAFTPAFQRLEADTTLSRADRLAALIARVDLARIDTFEAGGGPEATTALPAALLADVREHAARVDREITDGYERQAVIPSAAYVLRKAGLDSESDALLTNNLAKSHSPYYLMTALASNAKARGDSAGALHWYEMAFDRSEGPATRLQWGASYVNALVDLAPQDEARIEKAAGALFAEAGKQTDAFYERSGSSLKRVGSKLRDWNGKGRHGAVMARLQTQVDGICAALGAADPKRAACEALLKPPAATPTT
ncbi:MAG: thioredoxin family protein, partial [Burkholderiaceae bacterium]